MIFSASTAPYGSFSAPQITLVMHRSAALLEDEFVTKIPRRDGVFCGVEAESYTLHLWCNPKKATLERIVAEIGEALAVLLFSDDAANIDAVAWVARQSFLWALKVVGPHIDSETLATVKAHRKRNLKQIATKKGKPDENDSR